MELKDKTTKKKEKEAKRSVASDEKMTKAVGEPDNRVKRAMDDERFASARRDPRFRRMPVKEKKVVLDSRFKAISSGGAFAASSAPVDKRGRPRRSKDAPDKEILQHYFLENEEEGDEKRSKGRAVPTREDATEDEEEEDEAEEDGGGVADVSGESSSSSDDEDESDDDEDDQYFVSSDIGGYLMANHEDTPMIDKETHRLAVVNMDWDYVKAVDLYMVMISCLPKGGQVLSVAVYPSEFGLNCMKIEAEKGPAALIDDMNEDSDSDPENNNIKLRAYELKKLRYYHAVVICDSSATANHLYATLDGTELTRTSNVFDLRFIPDSVEFNHPPRDIATEAPADYKEPDFETRALQHSKIKLTWDDDLPERKKILRRKFNADKLNEDDLNDYLAASDDSSSDAMDDCEYDDENSVGSVRKKERKKRLGREELLARLKPADKSDSEGKDDDVDMEITFKTDLENVAKRIQEKKSKPETVWEALERKRREKRKARKSGNIHISDESSHEESDNSDDFFKNDSDTEISPEKKDPKRKHKRSRKERDCTSENHKEQEASKEELELLVADDMDTHLNVGNDNNKTKSAKKRRKDRRLEDKVPDVDPGSDPRFAALLNKPSFALDPTDPQFKRSVAYLRQRQEKKQGKRSAKTGARDDSVDAPSDAPLPVGASKLGSEVPRFNGSAIGDSDFALKVRQMKGKRLKRT